MDRSEDLEDNETCAPEIICESQSLSFDESDYSNEDPISQSSNLYNLIGSAMCVDNKKTTTKHVSSNLTEKTCLNCNRRVNTSFNLPCFCSTHNEKANILNNLKNKGLEQNVSKIESKHKAIVCSCCREIGHIGKDCPKDPNTRTGVNPFDELQRISQLKQSKMISKIQTNRKYDVDKEGFSDIDCLKATIKEKNNLMLKK